MRPLKAVKNTLIYWAVLGCLAVIRIFPLPFVRRAFRALELEVTSAGLIPRPETETLVEVALEALVAGSEECTVWYPAGDLTGVDVVDDERVFVSRIVSAVAGGDIEPCLRFLRRGA